MSKTTPRPWNNGRLLITNITKHWTPAERERADLQERRMIFANFSSVDQGRGRQLIAVCEDKANAELIVKAVNTHDEMVKLLQRVVSDYEGEVDIGFDQTIVDIKDLLKRAKGE